MINKKLCGGPLRAPQWMAKGEEDPNTRCPGRHRTPLGDKQQGQC